MTIKYPPDDKAARCFQLRCKSKRGERLTIEELYFICTIYRAYSEWYKGIEPNVFNATVPIGSNIKSSEPEIPIFNPEKEKR